ncbi:hypothetical protein ABPG75_009269 [Micractinium tetrahymenae]
METTPAAQPTGMTNYSQDLLHKQFEPEGFQQKMAPWLPRYDPAKDLAMPLMKRPDHYHLSPLVGAPTRERTLLALHRGRVQMNVPKYSRGLRQRLAKAAQEGNWREKHSIAVTERDGVQGDYSELLASSTFCLVLPGDGWSARMDDATLHGCIPVVTMDEVDVSFESIIDLSAFTVPIAEKDAERLPEILQAKPEERRREMQRSLARVWHRFAYSSYRAYSKRFREIQASHRAWSTPLADGPVVHSPKPGSPLSAHSRLAPSLPETVPDLDPEADDAFATTMAWLYSRIEATR